MDPWFWLLAVLGVLLVGAELLTGVALGLLNTVHRQEASLGYWVIVTLHAVVFLLVLSSW
jgi:hypothetical protein